MAGPIDAGRAMNSALDALALRQRAITNNIANVDTPGFRSSDVKFEDALQRAMSSGSGSDGGLGLTRSSGNHLALSGGATGDGATAEVVTDTSTTLRADGNNVDIEQQMLHLSETVINYQALARLASQRLAFMRTAVNEGRR